jgi:hypothetical protein
MSDNRIILPAIVIDNEDPLRLGRIRCRPKTTLDNASVPTNSDGTPKQESKYAWTFEDPFVFLPLLPYYISQVPKVGEYAHIIYATRDEPADKNKFYIQGPISRPWNNDREVFLNSYSVLTNGTINEKPMDIIENGEEKEIIKGIYPVPGDNAILSRGSTDIILKKDEILLRSGKYLKENNQEESAVGQVQKPNVSPYDKRSFIQLSLFEQELVETGSVSLNEQFYIDLNVKNFIEWDITNIDFTGFTVDGSIKVNGVKPTETTKVSTFAIKSATTSNCNELANTKFIFTGLSVSDTVTLINNYIRGFNGGKINIPGYPKNTFVDQFPFVFGPSISTNNKLINPDPNVDPIESNFITEIYNQIKLFESNSESGFAVVWDYNTVGPQSVNKSTTVTKSEYKTTPVTYATMGGDYVYLLTHRTNNDKFRIDLNNTLYGISQTKFNPDLYNRTNSMVRGEELIELLRLMYKFLAGHVHNPVEPPATKVADGTTLDSIDQILKNAENIILNPNIRIN